VSAYESHIVNVQAHIQNALTVPLEVDFETSFPQEWRLERFFIDLSGSFCSTNQLRVSEVEFGIWVAKKVGVPDPPSTQTEFFWLGDALYLKFDPGSLTTPTGAGDMTRVDQRLFPANIVAPATPIGPVVSWILNKQGDNGVRLWVGMDTPLFEGFYNQETDPLPTPANLFEPSVVIGTGDERHIPDGVDLGVDLIVQVTSIHNPPDLLCKH
jgi:hypothetical protein